MRARINSTGRKKIPREMVAFATDADGSGKFSAFFKLEPLRLPNDAEVVVEAYRQSMTERFHFGSVGHAFPKDPPLLSDLDPSEVTFRVIVIEPNTGRLLARGDGFSPGEGEDSGRRPLLKVVVRDLGKQPWLVERGDAGMQLVLNSRIDDAERRLQVDPVFRALILPAALRQVLLHLWAERVPPSEDGDDDEVSLWHHYARELGCPSPDTLEDPEIARDWINAVCEAFCERTDYAAMAVGGEAQS